MLRNRIVKRNARHPSLLLLPHHSERVVAKLFITISNILGTDDVSESQQKNSVERKEARDQGAAWSLLHFAGDLVGLGQDLIDVANHVERSLGYVIQFTCSLNDAVVWAQVRKTKAQEELVLFAGVPVRLGLFF